MELLLGLFGTLRGMSGEIHVDGRRVAPSSPKAARDLPLGLALIPEDRKSDGLMLPMSVADNLTFAALGRISRAGIVSSEAESEAVEDMVRLLGIRMDAPDRPVRTLSGGNQQKVVIAKWLLNKPAIILLNDPTRGIDVGTKQELYQLLRKLAAEGAAIILYSTDYYELIGCCDRVAVFYDGAIVRELTGDAITEQALVASAFNLAIEDVKESAAIPGVQS
jgi:ribose transport system ATP-binding protein